jgi:glycosyltransferase involved in cell wall biosynthesis
MRTQKNPLISTQPESKQVGGWRLKGLVKESSQDTPLISIITVVFNGEKIIEETIKSVISQTYPNIEYIVIDGSSTDSTLEVIRNYEHSIHYWLSEKDHGIYDAMNKAIDIARGELIYFLNAGDSLYEVNIVERIAKVYEPNNSVYGNVLFNQSQKIYNGKFSKLKLLHKNICHQSIFYNNHFLKKNKFDLHYSILADYAINFKLFGKSPPRYADIIVARYDENGKSSREVDLLFRKDKEILIKDNFGPFYHLIYLFLRGANNLKKKILISLF